MHDGTLNLEALRADTPGCKERLHLNNAGAALMPAPVLAAIHEHFDREALEGGYEAAEDRAEDIESCYRAVAGVLGAEQRHIALVENATVAFNQALSAIPFERGDVLLTTRDDYASNQIAYLSLARRLGVEIVRCPNAPEGGLDLEAMQGLIRTRRPRLVAVTWIPTNSGLVQPAADVGRLCQEGEVLYLLDGCQAVGQRPVDMKELGCDLFSATSRKYLRGPRGAGFLYVSDRVLESNLDPLFPDMRGGVWETADRYRPEADARRFENWEFAYALVLGTGEAARYLERLGIEATSRRAVALGARLRTAVAEVPGVRVLDRGPELCAIVTIALPTDDPSAIHRRLRQQGINTSLSFRRYAVLDFDDKGVDCALRVSPHYYNTEEEIDTFVEALKDGLGD